MASVTDYFFPLVYVEPPKKEAFFDPSWGIGAVLKQLDDFENKSRLVSQTRMVALDLLILADRLFVSFPKALGKVSLVGLNALGIAYISNSFPEIYKAFLDVVLSVKRRDLSYFMYSALKVVNAVANPILMLGTCTASTLSLFSFASGAWQLYSVVNPYAAANILLWGIAYFGDFYINQNLKNDLTDFSLDIAMQNIITSLKDKNELNVNEACHKIFAQIDTIKNPNNYFDELETAGNQLKQICESLKSNPELIKELAFIQHKQEECESLLEKIHQIKQNPGSADYVHNWKKVAEIFWNVFENPLYTIEDSPEGALAARTIYQLNNYDLGAMRMKYFELNQQLLKAFPSDRESTAYEKAKDAFLKEIYASTVIKISSKLTYMVLDFTMNLAGALGRIVRKFFPLTAFEIAIDTFFAMIWWMRNYIEYKDKKCTKDNVSSVMKEA
ncbi:MAG: hypothetical protein WC222_08700 [Parachlamydiales bacterium]|jgi:hypothetical protein